MRRRSKLATYLVSIFLLYFGLLLKTSYAQNYYRRTSCQLPDGLDGKCVWLKTCKPLQDLLKTLRPPFPPAVTKQLRAYICNSKKQVCCPPGPVILDPPDVTRHPNVHLLPTECGNLNDNTRITNGNDADLNEFPFMALLQYNPSDYLGLRCGGTILNSNYILTAAHCLNPRLVSVRVGEHSIKNATDCEVKYNRGRRTIRCNPPVQDLTIEKRILHPQFKIKGSNILNDIALLRVSTIRDAVNVFPVCLPLGTLRDLTYDSVMVIGWGLTLTNTYSYEAADILQKVGLPFINKTTCAGVYGENRFDATKPEICAGGKDEKSSCKGDSGGPMLVHTIDINYNPIYVQYGIISRGPGICENEDQYGMYVNVKFYMDWILDNMTP